MALRGFFATASASGELHATMIDGTLEGAVVIRAFSGKHLVSRRFRRRRLQELLKFALGIVEIGRLLHFGAALLEKAKHELASRIKAAIQIHRANHRLKGIGYGGATASAAAGLLTAAEDDMLPQVQPAGLTGKRGPVHQLGARLGKRAFTELGKAGVQLAGDHELDDGVAEKFEALVVVLAAAGLVSEGRVGEGEGEKVPVAKAITESGFQFGKGRH